MLAAGTTTWHNLAAESFIGRIANIRIASLWSVVLGGSYDDAQVCFYASRPSVSMLVVMLLSALSGSYWLYGKYLTTGHHTELTTALSWSIFDISVNLRYKLCICRIVRQQSMISSLHSGTTLVEVEASRRFSC